LGVQKEPSPIHVNVGDDVVGRCVGGSVGTCVGGDCDVLCCVVLCCGKYRSSSNSNSSTYIMI
jgi:hypothetical protein